MTGRRPQASRPRGRERDEASGSPAAGVGRELGLHCCLRLFRVMVTAAQSTLHGTHTDGKFPGSGSLEAGKRQGCRPALSLPPEEAPGGSGRAGPRASTPLPPAVFASLSRDGRGRPRTRRFSKVTSGPAPGSASSPLSLVASVSRPPPRSSP